MGYVQLKNYLPELSKILTAPAISDFHEYYDPETGEGICNKGFSSWNLLAMNMLAYFEGGEVVEEFV